MSREKRFTGTIQSFLNCARLFEENYAVSFVETRVLDILNDLMPWNILAANSKATYAHYICVAKMMMKNKGVLSLLVSLPMDAPVVKTLSITHLDDQAFTFSMSKISFSSSKPPMKSWKKTTNPHFFTPVLSTAMKGLSLISYTFFTLSRVKEVPNIHAFLSNEGSADEQHHPYNTVYFHYHDASFRLRRLRWIGEVGCEGGDAEEASAFRSGPPVQSRW